MRFQDETFKMRVSRRDFRVFALSAGSAKSFGLTSHKLCNKFPHPFCNSRHWLAVYFYAISRTSHSRANVLDWKECTSQRVYTYIYIYIYVYYVNIYYVRIYVYTYIYTYMHAYACVLIQHTQHSFLRVLVSVSTAASCIMHHASASANHLGMIRELFGSHLGEARPR